MSTGANIPEAVSKRGDNQSAITLTIQDAGWLTRIIFIIAAFCVLVSGYMFYQHARSSERDPWKSPQLLALKEKLRLAPTDESVKSEIRRLDLEFRQRYMRRLSLNRTGGWLLVGGIAGLLVAARKTVKLKSRPWLPTGKPAGANEVRQFSTQARWSVAGVGVVALMGFLALAFTRSSPLPRSATELAALLNPATPAENVVAVTPAELQANWPQFRGFEGRGLSSQKMDFSTGAAGVIWTSSVPAVGFNSPVVWSNRLFLSGGDAAKREVFCYDAWDGKLLWQRAVANVPGSPAQQPDIPEMTGFAAPTMATDGRRAYVLFGNADLAAFNFDGSLAWATHLGVPKNMYGHAASLALAPGKLVVQMEQDEGAPGGSALLVIDGASGRVLLEKSKPTHDSWASPIVIEAAGQTQIITLALPFAMSHALADGRELWRAEVMAGELAPSPIYAGGLVIMISPANGLIGIRPDGSGDVTQSHVAWTAAENIPDITSPVSNRELVFTVTTMGEVACFDLTQKKTIWQKALEFEVQSSPAIVGDQLVIVSTPGDVVLVAVAREFQELGRFKLEDEFHASPAFANGRMYLRGKTNLWCLGNN
jgi:outer membrane protein assembly factor BamB